MQSTRDSDNSDSFNSRSRKQIMKELTEFSQNNKKGQINWWAAVICFQDA